VSIEKELKIVNDLPSAFVWFDVASFPPDPPILVAEGLPAGWSP